MPKLKSINTNRFVNLGQQPTQNAPAQQKSSTPQYGGKFSNLGTLTTDYGEGTRIEKFHPGLDIANKIGTPIPSFVGGKVIDLKTGRAQGEKNAGNYVLVEDAQGNKHRYSHLNNVWVKVGQTVNPGTLIGGMGNTGNTYSLHGGTGSHLDYRITNAYNKYINPFDFYKKVS